MTLDFIAGCVVGGLVGVLLCALFVVAQEKQDFERFIDDELER